LVEAIEAKSSPVRRTKILCTLGPASNGEGGIRALLAAGMDGVRLNFSHGTQKDHEETFELVRRIAARAGTNLAVVQDIQGPKIRTGDLPEEGVPLVEGTEVVFVPGEKAPAGEIPITYDQLARDVKAGDPILMDDGYLGARVQEVSGRRVVAKVENGGILKRHKGVNFPGVRLSIKFPTEKDRRDLRFGQDLGVDLVAASFVRSAADIARIRADLDDRTRVIAKIELREGVDNAEEILRASDGVLIARGDLGVELPPEEVPLVQKSVIRRANELGVPAITATQMLESMIHNPRPTRAEVTDVANAILDGTDVVMLSGETAVGSYGPQAVQVMSRIAARAETLLWGREHLRHAAQTKANPEDAVAHAAVSSAEDLQAAAIVVVTSSGTTARLVAKHKPRVPILALSPEALTARQMNLLWGVHPRVTEKAQTMRALLERARDDLLAEGYRPDDVIVFLSGKVGIAGSTNHLRITRVKNLLESE
jgi:pyruvate kinase